MNTQHVISLTIIALQTLFSRWKDQTDSAPHFTVYESGDLSLKFAPGAANGVDINYAEVLASENYTIGMTVYPAGHEFATVRRSL